MKTRLSNRLADLERPESIVVAEKVRQLKSEGVVVVDLSIGQPDLTPEFSFSDLLDKYGEDIHKYSPSAGVPALKQQIAMLVSNKYDVDCSEANVLITPGAKQGIYYALLSLCDAGHAVIIPQPSWLSYINLVNLAGATPVPVDSYPENGFIPTIEAIRAAITSRTKLIIINNPVNPVGVFWPEQFLKELICEMHRANITVLLDSIYDDFNYENSLISLGHFDQSVLDNIVLAHGFSKSHLMTGYRIGYLFANREMIERATLFQEQIVTCPSTIAQYFALQAMTSGKFDLSNVIDVYRRRVVGTMKKCDELGLSYIRANGAFYLMIDSRFISEKSSDAAIILLEKAKVATVPGSAYGASASGFVRVSLVQEQNILDRGMELISSL